VFYWVLKTVVLGPLLRILFRPWVEGDENIPEDGAAIFASNHLSFSDSIFLPLVLPRRLTFLAKADYFTGRGLKGRATAAFFRGVGQLPVDRTGGKAGEAALSSGLKILRRGELLALRWRDVKDMPSPAGLISSPYDIDARYSTKREVHWVGYKAHLTETCEADRPHLIVNVATTPATTPDDNMIEVLLGWPSRAGCRCCRWR